LKKNKFFLVFILTLITTSSAYSQVSNPFLKNSPQGNVYSGDKRTVLIVFDASASMEEKINGETKIHIAKRALDDVLLNAPQDINLGLRVYGANSPKSNPYVDCFDSKLIVPPGISNRRTIVSEIYKILPRGFTPITYSLSQALQDISPYTGEKSIILISDGLETCGGDPCELAKTINLSGIDLKIDVVGFGVSDDVDAQNQLMCIATSTMAKYFEANNSDDLVQGLKESINKNVTGKIITMISAPPEIMITEPIYEKIPTIEPEKINLKRRK
jgi:Ca-activated chloride channel family protein